MPPALLAQTCNINGVQYLFNMKYVGNFMLSVLHEKKSPLIAGCGFIIILILWVRKQRRQRLARGYVILGDEAGRQRRLPC